jgi:hypothetical protein
MPIHKGCDEVSIGYDRESVLEGQINGSYVHKNVHGYVKGIRVVDIH